MLPKEKEFIRLYRETVDSKAGDNFLSSSIIDGLRVPVPQFICFKHSLPFLSAAIEMHKHTEGLTSPPVLEALVNSALSDRENKQRLSEEDYWNLATIPLSNKKYKPMQVHKGALTQLRTIPLMKDKEQQRKAALVIYKTILDTYSTLSIQQQILKHWSRIGNPSEIGHLLTALSTTTSPVSISEKKVYLFEVDCNKFSTSLKKVSEQKMVLDHAYEVVRAFSRQEKNKESVLIENKDVLQNKILVYLNEDAKIYILQELMEICLSDIQNVVKHPAIDTYNLAVNHYKSVSLKVELDKGLIQKEPSRKIKV